MKVYKFILSALLTGLLCSCQNETIRIIEPNETFSVTFYSKDGQIIDSQTIKYGSTVRKPVNPTKTGYTFKSWNYTENNGNYVEYPFSLAVTQDLSLTAEYSANSYTINFEKNSEESSGTNIMTPLVCLYDNEQKLPANTYNIAGKSFLGWATSYTNAENKKIEYKDEEVIKNLTDINGENIIFYAIWDSNSYHKIKYELNGGQNSLNNKSKFLETQDVVLYEPRKEDSEFLGWYDNPEFEGKKIIGWSSGQYTSDIILYAKWNSPEYTVTFNDRDNVFYQKVEYGRLLSDIKLPEVSGATFGGFYTQKYGKGEQYIDSYGYAIKEFNQKSDLELYAFWNFKIYYDISYVDSMYGANINPTTYTGERDIVLKEMLCRVGYVFEGWLDEYGDVITFIPKDTYGQRTIKCKGIKPQIYTITYVINGGIWDTSEEDGKYLPPESYIIGDEIFLPSKADIKKTGYTFAGWYTNPGFIGDSVVIVKGTAESYGNLTFYAKWE